VLGKALAAKDELTIDVVNKAAYYLGIHAASVINALDPEIFIYGGGVMEALGEHMIPIVRKVALQNTIYKAEADKIKFVKSPLGDNAGALGAAIAGLKKAKLIKG
jgi:glucokinase